MGVDTVYWWFTNMDEEHSQRWWARKARGAQETLPQDLEEFRVGGKRMCAERWQCGHRVAELQHLLAVTCRSETGEGA